MADYTFIIVIVLLQIALLTQLYYILVVHSRLRKYKRPEKQDVQHPVSVIICARNEEENLEKNLPAVLEQDYPNFEVVVVNDCSVDESDLVLMGFSNKYPHLKVVTLTEHARYKHGKKFAVTLGIKAASNEYLIFTDADCQPASPNWINKIQENFHNGAQIVLGYSPYDAERGFLNKLIRFETINTALSYLSFSLSGKPYMGVGRNLAYTKSLFFKGKGFASHMHIPSGDDDLFVNQNATPLNTVIEIDDDAQVWSEPKHSYSSYVKQKIRHLGAGKVYKAAHRQMLSLQTGSALLFYSMLGLLVALNTQWYIVFSFYLVRLVVQLIIYYPVFKRLNGKDLIWWFPALDLIYNFYILVLSIISLFKKTIKWK